MVQGLSSSIWRAGARRYFLAVTSQRRIMWDPFTWGWCLQQHRLAPVKHGNGGYNASALIALFWPLCLTQKRFGMHIHWLLSVEQTRINPFTCNPAKLPCRQALHLKCTISYPCLVWMRHFWDINPRGNTRRMAAATPYIEPPCCLFSVSASVCVSLFPFILIASAFYSLPFISWDELESVSRRSGWGRAGSSQQYLFWQEHKHAPWASWSGLRE